MHKYSKEFIKHLKQWSNLIKLKINTNVVHELAKNVPNAN